MSPCQINTMRSQEGEVTTSHGSGDVLWTVELHQTNAIRPQAVYIHMTHTHTDQGHWLTCRTLISNNMPFLYKELHLTPGRPTTSVEIFTETSLPGQFSNVLIDQLQSTYKISINVIVIKLPNGKLDGLASDLGFT